MLVEPFDDLFDDQPPKRPEPAARDFEVVPEGRTDLEVVAAKIGQVPWRVSDANPSGTSLQLRLSAGRRSQFVFADVALDRLPLLRAVAAALGLEPGADGNLTIDRPDELVGRRVRVEIGHFQNRDGQTKAAVRRWLPMRERVKAKLDAPPAAPKRSRNAVRPAGDDEIPF